jgi:hypothetical protein
MYNDIKKSDKPSPMGKFVSRTWKGFKVISPVLIAIVIGIAFVIGVNSALNAADERNYPYGDYEMVYRVYYDVNTIKEYTVKHNRPMWQGSSEGTNYIKKYPDIYVIRTNAPIEVVKYVNYQE